MNYLYPLAWGLIGLSIPVLILYLIRQRSRVRMVSTLLFWDQIQPQVHNRPFWRHFRQWISYLLQVLFIGLLTFALARPYIASHSSGENSYIFVLDSSYSMLAKDEKGRRFWDEAVGALKRRIGQLRYIDKATLIQASAPPKVLQSWTRSRRLLREALVIAEPGGTDQGLMSALELAVNLAEKSENSTILLFTDGIWDIPIPDKVLRRVAVQRVGTKRSNVGISQFSARRTPGLPGEFSLMTRVDYAGSEEYRGKLLFWRNGELMDARNLVLQAGEHWETAWTEHSKVGIDFKLELEPPEGDALLEDDQASVRLEPLSKVVVNLVSPPNSFLFAAFLSLPEVDFKHFKPNDELPEPALDRNECWVFYKTAPPDGFLANSIVFINPPGSGYWGEFQRESSDATLITDWATDESLMHYVNLDAVNLRKVSEFEAAPGSTIFAQSLEIPLIYGHWQRSPKWLVFTFDLDQSDLALRTAFPILMGNIVQSLRKQHGPSVAKLPGIGETVMGSVFDSEDTVMRHDRIKNPTFWTKLVGFPLWWWAACLGLIWCMGEWWLFSRRITE